MKRKTTVDSGCCKRQEEHHQNLAVDRGIDLPLLHTDLFKDCKAFFVFITFGYLFIIDDQDGCHDKEKSQKDPKEKQSAVQAVKFRSAFCPVLDSIHKSVWCIFLFSKISMQTACQFLYFFFRKIHIKAVFIFYSRCVFSVYFFVYFPEFLQLCKIFYHDTVYRICIKFQSGISHPGILRQVFHFPLHIVDRERVLLQWDIFQKYQCFSIL